MIPDEKIAEIRERVDIVEIVGGYISLKKAGNNYKGVCPFHADSDPSFSVNPSRHFFHCFGCGVSGDVFSFIQRIEGMEFIESARFLAGKCGVELPEKPMSVEARGEQERARQERNSRVRLLEVAAAFFEEELWSDSGREARKLLEDRGISRDTAVRFRLGYAPDEWQALMDHLRKRNISAKDAFEAGLVSQRKSGDGFFDRFRGRLVFTITDASGHPIAFSARTLKKDDSAPKYINSPETKDYRKGRVLYGIHQARVALSKEREAVLVEGNFDVVAMHEAGIENVLAPLGTAFTEEQAALLRRRVDRVTVMFDGDRAGIKAAARAFPILAQSGMAAYMAALPEGEDPDSFVRNRGRAQLEAVLKRARGLLDVIVGMTADASDKSPQDVARRVRKLKPLVFAVRDPMERDLYMQKVAGAFGLEPALVFRYLRNAATKEEKQENRLEKEPIPGFVEERELLGLLMDLPKLSEQARETGAIALIRTPELREIADRIVADSHPDSVVSEIISEAKGNPAASWLARRGMNRLFESEEKGTEALDEIRKNMEKRETKMRIGEIEKEIKSAHSSGDDMKVLSLQRRKTELEKEIMA